MRRRRRSQRSSTAGAGIYNVVDDDPAPVAEWLPGLAQQLGAKKPMHMPRFIARLFAGEAGVVMMTEIRGASNAKAKRETGMAATARELAAGLHGDLTLGAPGMTDRERPRIAAEVREMTSAPPGPARRPTASWVACETLGAMVREFDAHLEKGENPGAWTCVIMSDVAELFGTRGLVKIRGAIDGRPFDGALMAQGDGTHRLPVKASLRKAIGKEAGDSVHVRIDARIG